jgi:hypothetical protein
VIWEEYPELADPAACLALTEQCGYEGGWWKQAAFSLPPVRSDMTIKF